MYQDDEDDWGQGDEVVLDGSDSVGDVDVPEGVDPDDLNPEIGYAPEVKYGTGEAGDWGKDDDVLDANAHKPKAKPTVHPSGPKMSAATSAIYGAGTGATFGFLDEAGAVMDGIFGDYAGDGERTSFWEGMSQGKSLGDVYNENVGKNRAVLAQAQQDNPGAYLAGDIATVFIPGMGWMKVAKNGTILGKAAKGAGIGAAAGGARGVGDGVGGRDSAQKGVQGAAVGGVLGGVIGAAAPILGKVDDGLGYVGDKINDGYRWAGDQMGSIASHVPGLDKVAGMLGMHPAEAAMRGMEKVAPRHAGPVRRAADAMGGPQAIAPRIAATKATMGGNLAVEGAVRGTQMAARAAAHGASNPRSIAQSTQALAGEEIRRKDKVSTSLQDPQAVIAAAKGTKFEAPLVNAQKGGRQKFLAILHVLRTNPEFRSMVESKMQR